MIKYCKCGCGKIVKRDFISGHNTRVKSWNKGKTDNYSKEARYRMGNSFRGKKRTLSSRKKQSNTLIKKYEKGYVYPLHGNKPWNKGLTRETDERVNQYVLKGAKKQKGKKLSNETIRKIVKSRKWYKHHSEETKEKQRNKAIKRIEIQHFNGQPLMPTIGLHETLIINNLEKFFGYTIERQKRIAGYFLDGYCFELNMAIEVDECWHYKNGKLSDRDINRQKIIEDRLGCIFLRIKDSEVMT